MEKREHKPEQENGKGKDPKFELKVWLVCGIVFLILAIVRYAGHSSTAWICAVCAVIFIIGGIKKYIDIRKNKMD